MNIQLPNLDINIDEGLDNKEILQQILDAIHKQRKELNFYLMNLDESNMPTIANRIEDAEGNISIINQDIDEIFLSVGNAQGDIAALEIRADEIEATVADNAGNISSLQQTATSLTSRISNVEGNISIINQTVSGIQTIVADLDDDMDWTYSQIRQLYNELDFVIYDSDLDGEEIITRINLTPGHAYIDADVIDLRGITTIYADGDDRTYARFDRYGDFYIEYLGHEIFTLYNSIDGVDIALMDNLWIRYGALGDITAYREWTFRDDVYFKGNVYGLNAEPDYRYMTECYYSANKCYIDYDGENRLTIRDRYGDVVGYISFD